MGLVLCVATRTLKGSHFEFVMTGFNLLYRLLWGVGNILDKLIILLNLLYFVGFLVFF